MTETDILDQFQRFDKSDEDRRKLMESLVQDLNTLRVEYAQIRQDFENEKVSRRNWQDQSQALKKELSDIESDPFAVALIDADGAVFQDALVSAGRDGGSDAASKLQKELKNHLSELFPSAGNWPIFVQVYANLDGLAKKLCSVNIIKTPSEFHLFSTAFSLNQPLFNFVDVGSGKERADHKIKEMLRFFISNRQCKHIFFGACHDNGYLTVLDQYKLEESVSSRITLLESTPAQRGFQSLKFNIVCFPSVFRKEPLPDRPSPKLPQANPTLPFQPKPPPSNVAPQSPVQISPSHSDSWASLSKNGVGVKNISIATTQNSRHQPKKSILVNSMWHRLDPPLNKPDRAFVESLHGRINNGKLCNLYHLKGECEGYCGFQHGRQLSAGEALAFKHMIRGRPCEKLETCRDFDCIYGHHCPRGPLYCIPDKCQFVDKYVHIPDQTEKWKIYEDATEERVY